MTAKEIIEELSKLPSDTEIYRWNDDNWHSYPTDIFEIKECEIEIHPVVDGVVTHTKINVITLV